jgi:hypothetical protein
VRELSAAGHLRACKTEGSRETEIMQQLGVIRGDQNSLSCETCDGIKMGDYQAEALRRLRMLREAQTLESLFTYELLYGGIDPKDPKAKSKLIAAVCSGGVSSFAQTAAKNALNARLASFDRTSSEATKGLAQGLRKFNQNLCDDKSFLKVTEKVADASVQSFKTPLGLKARVGVEAGLAPLNALTENIVATCKAEYKNYQKRMAAPLSLAEGFGDTSSKDTPAYLLKIEKQNQKALKPAIEFTRAALEINKSLKKMVESPYGRLLVTRSFRKSLGFDSLKIHAGNVVSACYSVAGRIAGAKKNARSVFEKSDVDSAMKEVRAGLANSMQDTLPYRFPRVFQPSREKLDKQVAAEMRAQTDPVAMASLLNEPELARAACSAMRSTAEADKHNREWLERIGYVQIGLGFLGGVLAPFTGGASLYASMAAGAGLVVLGADLELSEIENTAINSGPLQASQLRTQIEASTQEELHGASEEAAFARQSIANKGEKKEEVYISTGTNLLLIGSSAVVASLATQLVKPGLLRGAINVTNDYVVAPVVTHTFNTQAIAEDAIQDFAMQELNAVVAKKFGYKGGRLSVAPQTPDWWDRRRGKAGEPPIETRLRLASRAQSKPRLPGSSEIASIRTTFEASYEQALKQPDGKEKVLNALRYVESEQRAAEAKSALPGVEGMANRDHAKRIAAALNEFRERIKEDFGVDAQPAQQGSAVVQNKQDIEFSVKEISTVTAGEVHRKSLSDLMATLPKDQQELIKKYPDEPWEQMSPEKRNSRLNGLAQSSDAQDRFNTDLQEHLTRRAGGAKVVEMYLMNTNQKIESAYGKVSRAKKSEMISALDEKNILTEAKESATKTLGVIKSHLSKNPSIANEVDVRGTEKMISDMEIRIQSLQKEIDGGALSKSAGPVAKKSPNLFVSETTTLKNGDIQTKYANGKVTRQKKNPFWTRLRTGKKYGPGTTGVAGNSNKDKVVFKGSAGYEVRSKGERTLQAIRLDNTDHLVVSGFDDRNILNSEKKMKSTLKDAIGHMSKNGDVESVEINLSKDSLPRNFEMFETANLGRGDHPAVAASATDLSRAMKELGFGNVLVESPKSGAFAGQVRLVFSKKTLPKDHIARTTPHAQGESYFPKNAKKSGTLGPRNEAGFLIDPAELPDSHPFKKELIALRDKHNIHLFLNDAVPGKRGTSVGEGTIRIGDQEVKGRVITLNRTQIYDEKLLQEVLDHEVGHSADKKKYGKDRVSGQENAKKTYLYSGHTRDEFTRQTIDLNRSLRRAPESEIQAKFSKSDTLPVGQVLNLGRKVRIQEKIENAQAIIKNDAESLGVAKDSWKRGLRPVTYKPKELGHIELVVPGPNVNATRRTIQVTPGRFKSIPKDQVVDPGTWDEFVKYTNNRRGASAQPIREQPWFKPLYNEIQADLNLGHTKALKAKREVEQAGKLIQEAMKRGTITRKQYSTIKDNLAKAVKRYAN